MILKFPGHTRYRCDDPCPYPGSCMFCEGSIFACTTCKGGEGSLPTDCPGEPMTHEQIEGVYEARLDYRRGQGWVRAPARQWA